MNTDINSRSAKIAKGKSKLNQRTSGQNAIFIVVFTIFIIYGASLMYPLLWGLISSFKNGAIEYFGNSYGLPAVWKLANYSGAFKMLSANGIGFATMTINSLWFAMGGSLIGVFFLSMFAYVMARFKFPGRTLILNVSIIMMMIPIYGSLPSQYSLYRTLRIANSPLILLTFTGVMGTNALLITRSFYANIPNELSEAATVDGASDWRILFQIMIPMARGILLSFLLLNFISNWNDFMTPLLYLSRMPTLATGLYVYQTIVERSGNYPLYFAGIAISAIPLVILYTVLNKHLVNNMAYGGIKG